jgi:hypothetical protein
VLHQLLVDPVLALHFRLNQLYSLVKSSFMVQYL